MASAPHFDRQYRPVSTLETATDDGLSVRLLARQADNINNWHAHVGAYPLVGETWVADGSSVTDVVSANATTAEKVVLCFGQRYLDRAYPALHYYIQGRVYAGAGSTTWTLYAGTRHYTGTETIQTGYLGDYGVREVEISSATWEVQEGTIASPYRTTNSYLYLYLSAKNSDNSTRSTLLSVTLQPFYFTAG